MSMIKQILVLFCFLALGGCKIKAPQLPSVEDNSFSYDEAIDQQKNLERELMIRQ